MSLSTMLGQYLNHTCAMTQTMEIIPRKWSTPFHHGASDCGADAVSTFSSKRRALFIPSREMNNLSLDFLNHFSSYSHLLSFWYHQHHMIKTCLSRMEKRVSNLGIPSISLYFYFYNYITITITFITKKSSSDQNHEEPNSGSVSVTVRFLRCRASSCHLYLYQQ